MRLFVDSCAWDWLFANEVDLQHQLAGGDYKLSITREGEIELAAMP